VPESLTGAWQQAIDRRAPELEERVFVFLNEQLRRMLSRYVRGQQPMVADENTWLARILVDYYDRDLARELLKEPPPGVNEQEAKSYRTIYGTVDSLDDVFRVMQSHQDAMSQARLVNETTRKILEQFLTGGEDNTPDAVRSFLMSNPNFSNVTKPEFEALVKNISKQVEETYRNRARTIARTELAIAQSKTVAQELRAQGKTHVRIYDGLGCGWRHHDDGDYANGSLRLIEDYLNYPVAHPNCVRAGYPDFFGGDGSIHVGKKDLDLFAVAADRLKGQQTKSLEAVSANQKSLDGVSNRPDGSGDPLDLLEGSERVRKYNPYHDRLGRFATSGGAPTLTEDDYARAEELFARVDMNAFGADPALQLIQDERGRLAPTVLDAEAFDKYEGETLYRGVRPEKVRPKYDQNDPWGLSAKTESYEFMRGELDGSSPYTGFGVHGNGLYFTPDVKIAKTFAAPIDPVIFRAKVSTSAKIIDYETLKRLSQEAASRGGRGGRLLADPGRLAAFLGFDGYSLFGDATGTRSAKQVVIVNRAALVWDKSVFDSALGAAKKNWGLKFNPNHDRLGRFATGSAGGAFTEEDKAAVSTYLKPQKAAWSEEVNHRVINDQLRGMAEHDRPDVSDAITKLDAAFAHGDTIPAGTELYRGIPGVRLSEVYKVGDTFTDYGFSSHSKNEGEAFDFITGRAQMGTANSRATGTLLNVKVTQPTKAIDVAQHFDDPLYKREQEVLLNRGTKFRVTEIYTGPMADIEDVIVEVVR